jgi:hypothetical protein
MKAESSSGARSTRSPRQQKKGGSEKGRVGRTRERERYRGRERKRERETKRVVEKVG